MGVSWGIKNGHNRFLVVQVLYSLVISRPFKAFQKVSKCTLMYQNLSLLALKSISQKHKTVMKVALSEAFGMSTIEVFRKKKFSQNASRIESRFIVVWSLISILEMKENLEKSSYAKIDLKFVWLLWTKVFPYRT